MAGKREAGHGVCMALGGIGAGIPAAALLRRHDRQRTVSVSGGRMAQIQPCADAQKPQGGRTQDTRQTQPSKKVSPALTRTILAASVPI